MPKEDDCNFQEHFAKSLDRRKFLRLGCYGLLASAGWASLASAQIPLAPRINKPFSFAYVSDTHLITGTPDNYVLLQESQLFLQDTVRAINKANPDFVIFGGDQVDMLGTNNANWGLFGDIVDTLTAPWNFVLGEHDLIAPPSKNRLPFDKMSMYGIDWRTNKVKTTTPYWSWLPLPQVQILALDTSQQGSDTGFVSKEQLDWLQAMLNLDKETFTIVVSHHPLLAPPPFDRPDFFNNYLLPQAADVREILSKAPNVAMALSDHIHVSAIQKENHIWYVSNPSLDVYPCAWRLFKVTESGITVETKPVRFPALVKKARTDIASSPFAQRYNPRKPGLYAEVLEGKESDQNAFLAFNSKEALAVKPTKEKKEKK
jgi:hypothetical protein